MIKSFLKTKWIRQFVKYGFVGGLNFILSLVLFYTLLKIMHIKYLIAFTITWLFGIVLTYVINFVWVFKPEEILELKKRFFKYFLVYLVSYLVNVGLLKYLVQKYGFDPFWLQFFILPIVVIINFLGFKFWALRTEKV
jgi:putative flippase GtrA